MNRREALQAVGLVSMGAALAGCSSSGSSGSTARRSGTASSSPGSVSASGGVLAVDAPRMAAGSASQAGGDLVSFGVRLLLADSTIGATSNGSISPYSVYAALAMTDAGARGTTASQLAKALGGDQRRQAGNITAVDDAVRAAVSASGAGGKQEAVVRAANSLWPDTGLTVRPAFLRQLAVGYAASVRPQDFSADPAAAMKAINAWVKERTAGLIPNLLHPGDVSSHTRIELVNALYLKAAWTKRFDAPRDGTFTTATGESVTARMMTAQTTYSLRRGTGWIAIRVPYRGDKLAMTVLVPDAGKFAAVRSDLASVLPKALVEGTATSVQLTMPGFGIDTRSALVGPLRTLGVRALFSGADLSGIAGAPGELSVGNVVHQSVVKVDRDGTQAAAATAVGVGAAAAGQGPTRIRVDRPFIFVVHDTTTNAPLFLGQVTDPS